MTVQAGVIGLGRAGWQIHVAQLARMQAFKVAAVADPMQERLDEAAATLGCRTYTDAYALTTDPELDLVVVASPNHTHVPYAMAALKAGKHVIVDKPVATRLADMDALMAEAKRGGRTLAPFHSRRFDGDFVKIRKIIDSGVLGPLHMVKIYNHGFSRRNDWQTLRRMGGGQLTNWGSHALDKALTLLNWEVDKVFGDMTTTVCAGDAEDQVKVVLKGKNGLLIDVEVAGGCALPQAPWVIMGKYGTLTGTHALLEWKYYDPSALPPVQIKEDPGRSYDFSEQIPWQTCSCETGGMGESHALWYAHFAAAWKSGGPMPTTAQQARHLIAIQDEVRRQSREEV